MLEEGSEFLIALGTGGGVKGVATYKELLEGLVEGSSRLSELRLSTPFVVKSEEPLDAVYRRMRNLKLSLAVVVDNSGNVIGVLVRR